jgi:hypothetical protein
MFFTFADRKDQIIAFGAADYSPSAPEFEAGRPAVRAALARRPTETRLESSRIVSDRRSSFGS